MIHLFQIIYFRPMQGNELIGLCRNMDPRRASDRVVLDSGFKTLSSYHHAPEVLHRNDLTLRYLSAEHGVFDIVPGQDGPALGEKIELLVGYSDSTTMLHEDFVGIRDGRVEELFAISARGLVR